MPLYVFEPLDQSTLDAIEEEVYNVITYDPRFNVSNTNVKVDQDEHAVTISVELIYLPTTTVTELQIKFDREFEQNAEF